MIETPLHVRSLNGSFSMPKIYISRITLSDASGGEGIRDVKPEISSLGTSIFRSEKSNDVSRSKKTKVKINMVAYLSEKQISLYSNSSTVFLRIVKSENKEISESISTNPHEWLPEGGLLYELNQETTSITHNDISIRQSFKNKSVLRGLNDRNIKESNNSLLLNNQMFKKITFSNGIVMHEVPYETSFIIDSSEISDLSLFAFPIVKGVSLDRLPNQIAKKSSIGFVTCENIYSQGALVRESFAFQTPSGEYWTGPVHYHGQNNPTSDGYIGWMGGTTEHMSMGFPSPKLTKIVIDNNKIIDQRLSDKVRKMSFDFYGKNSFLKSNRSLVRTVENNRSEREFEKKKNITSDINYSFDSDGNARFIFHINMEQILKDSTKYPELIDQIKSKNNLLYSSLLSTQAIGKIRIYRQLLKNGTNALRDKSPSRDPSYPQEELIFESSAAELQLGSVLYERPLGAGGAGRATLGSKQKPISVMSKINLKISNSNEIATYTGIDLEVKDLGEAKYQYYLELSISDPIRGYLNSSINNLNRILDGNNISVSLRQYYDESVSKAEFYDEKSEKYTERYLSFYNQNYIKQSLNEDQKMDYVESIIRSYTSILSLLNTGNDYHRQRQETTTLDEIQELYKYMVNIASPYTGSPSGVLEVISLVESTRDKLLKVASNSFSYPNNRDGDIQKQSSPNINSEKRQLFTTKRYTFDNILDTSHHIDGKFYEFIFMNKEDKESNQDGLLMINKKYFTDRVNMEAKMLFGRPEGDLVIRDRNDNIYNPADSIERSKFSFLSPSRVIMGEQKSLETYSRNGFNEDIDKINEVFNEVIMYNQSISTKTSINLASQNGLSFRLKKNRDYQSQKDQQKTKEVFSKSNSDSIYNDEPSLFQKSEDLNGTEDNFFSNRSAVNIFNSINQSKNSKFLSNSNKVDFYDINKSDGAKNFKRKSITESQRETQEATQGINSSIYVKNELVNAPNHLKSLISLSSSPQQNQIGILTDDDSLGKDFLRDPRKQGYVYFNYKKIMRIEVLRGFKFDNETQSTKSPIWSLLRQEDLSSRSSSLLYCRMVEYENSDYGYEADNSLSLPARNEYFLINLSGQALESIPSSVDTGVRDLERSFRSEYRKSFDKSMKDFSDQRSKLFGIPTRIARPEFFENNIQIKTNQPLINLNDFAYRYKIKKASEDEKFVNESRSEKVNRLERGGYGDLLRGRRDMRTGTRRGLQRTDPVDQRYTRSVSGSDLRNNRTTRQTSRSSNGAANSTTRTTGITSGGGGTY